MLFGILTATFVAAGQETLKFSEYLAEDGSGIEKTTETSKRERR